MFEFFNSNQKKLKKVAKKFVSQEIADNAAKWDENDICPIELWSKLGKMGFFGTFVSEQYGGSGLGITERAIILEEVARHSAGLAIGMMAHDLGIAAIYNFGSIEQKEKYLPDLILGENISSLAVTEVTGGSDLYNQSTSIKKNGAEYIINGRKVFITNSHIANVNVMTGVYRINESGRKELNAVLIPPNTKGLSAGRKDNKIGLRGSVTGELIAKNVRVPLKCLIGEEGKGAKVALHTIGHFGRSGMSAIALGILRGCIEESVKYAKEREIYGKPLIKLPAMQDIIAQNQIEYEAANAMLYNATTVYDRGIQAIDRLAAAKYFTTEAAVRCAKRTMDLMGGYGIISEYPIGRFLRDSVASLSSGGTSNIMKIIVASNTIQKFCPQQT